VKKMGTRDIKAQEFRFKKNGDNLTGRLLEVYPTQFGGKSYDLENSNGERFYFFGSVQLDRLLADRIDTIVSITYKGTTQTKNNRTMKVFEVTSGNEENDELPEDFKAAETT
jgi:hypothetical protein